MPFGLHGAMPTFQRLVDRALEGCEAFTHAYIDDIAISSSSWTEHVEHLQQVLQALAWAGLKANPPEEPARIPGTQVPWVPSKERLLATLTR